TAALPILDRRRLQTFWNLHTVIGACPADIEQYFLCAYLHCHFFDRPPLLQRKRCGVGIVVLGAAAAWFCDPVGLGDQPGGVAAGNYFWADTRAERTRWPAALARVRPAVGDQIGRASCRERGWVSVVAGSVERKGG